MKGKNAAAATERARAREAEARDALRRAEIRANRAEAISAELDREIASLKEALVEARVAHTERGTYTEADVAALRAEGIRSHRRAVANGFRYLEQNGVEFIPRGEMGTFCRAFEIDPGDIFDEDAPRMARRTTAAGAVAKDELYRQARGVGYTL